MTHSDGEPVPFETALAELESILRCLEDGTTGLEESLARYERGVTLLKSCYAQLRQAEQRITLLTGTDESGRPVTQPFEPAATLDIARAAPKPRPRRADPDSNY
jgi:exodeoxyribonuclease VII small subunit